MMPGPETPDLIASLAIEERVELIRLCAARILDNAQCGRVQDPYSLAWAQQVVATVKPLARHIGTGVPA